MCSEGNPSIFHLWIILTQSCLPYCGLSTQRCSKQTSKEHNTPLYHLLSSLGCFPYGKINTVRSFWGSLVMLTSWSSTRSHTRIIIKTTWDYFRKACGLLEWRMYCIWRNWCISPVFLQNDTYASKNLPWFGTQTCWLGRFVYIQPLST